MPALSSRAREDGHEHDDTAAPGTVTGGVDTHSDLHVAAALDHLGGVLATVQFHTTPTGYRKLLDLATRVRPVHKVGVEGIGC